MLSIDYRPKDSSAENSLRVDDFFIAMPTNKALHFTGQKFVVSLRISFRKSDDGLQIPSLKPIDSPAAEYINGFPGLRGFAKRIPITLI